MAIHHDKTAYGKLQPDMQELTEEEISKMLKELALEEEEAENKDTEEGETDGKGV